MRGRNLECCKDKFFRPRFDLFITLVHGLQKLNISLLHKFDEFIASCAVRRALKYINKRSIVPSGRSGITYQSSGDLPYLESTHRRLTVFGNMESKHLASLQTPFLSKSLSVEKLSLTIVDVEVKFNSETCTTRYLSNKNEDGVNAVVE
jgi:hypothetical protein